MGAAATIRPFTPGTLGWSASDLDDAEIAREWSAGSYEIVEGVLTTMSPAYFAGGNAVVNLMFLLKSYSSERGLGWRFAAEPEIIVDEIRVARADGAMLTPADAKRQEDAVRAAGKSDPKLARLLVPPTLVIESVSPGHELHDHRTKRSWYAGFGVTHYWIVDAFNRTLECLRLNGDRYDVEATGAQDDVLEPASIPGLRIPLREVWES